MNVVSAILRGGYTEKDATSQRHQSTVPKRDIRNDGTHDGRVTQIVLNNRTRLDVIHHALLSWADNKVAQLPVRRSLQFIRPEG